MNVVHKVIKQKNTFYIVTCYRLKNKKKYIKIHFERT